MTREHYDCVARSLAAERAGDVMAALEWHQSVPMFRKGRHRSILTGLVDLGDELPEWVWARWIAYQVTRCEDGALGRSLHELQRILVHELHDDLLAECYRQQGDPIKVAARVAGQSWIYHQVAAYEAGGLRRFVQEVATDRLAEHAGLALGWADVAMGGYEIGESLPDHRLRVRDVSGGEWRDVLDLGARSCSPTGFVLGRLVPSGVGELPMFDVAPLGVRRDLARAVAAAAGGRWLEPIAAARDGGLASTIFLRDDCELTGDVPRLDLVRFGTPPHDLPRIMQQLREGRDEVSRAAYRVLDRARRGDVAPDDRAYVGAAVLNPRAFADIRAETVRSGGGACWSEWAARVADPSRGRLLELARAGRTAA